MAIIGLSGYIGSGKDTVGKIIQYLTSPYKSEYTYDTYSKFYWSTGSDSKWEIKKFAYKLKQVASVLLGVSMEQLEDQVFKTSYLGEEWNRDLIFGQGYEMTKVKMTVREFLQKLGTEACRNGLHPDVWVNALMSEYKFEGCNGNACETPNGNCDSPKCYPNWIITDLRFPNELKAIRERDGLVFRIERSASFVEYQHESETALDEAIFDSVIFNNGNIEELIIQVEEHLKENRII